MKQKPSKGSGFRVRGLGFRGLQHEIRKARGAAKLVGVAVAGLSSCWRSFPSSLSCALTSIKS